MNDEIGRDDTVLGTALARAIESQPARATPFERSRLAVRMAGGGARTGLMPLLAAAAAVVLGLALGAALLGQRGTDPDGGAATQPSPGPTASPAGSPTPTPDRGQLVRQHVFFARDQLPPVGAQVDTRMVGPQTPEGRIRARLEALATASAPAGATNAMGSAKATVAEVRIEGDLARVDFSAPNGAWGVSGSAMSIAVRDQLVYTATEEAGIRRVQITTNGQPTTIDQLVLDKPLAREDVLPYEGVKTEQLVELQDDPRPSETKISLDTSKPEIARFTVDIKARETPDGGFWTPLLRASLAPNGSDRPGKWVLVVELDAATHLPTAGDTAAVSTPVRSLQVVGLPPGRRGVAYNLFLDDARPWRVALEPGQPGTMRLIVDIGGHPQAISESVAVYDPTPGTELPRGGTRIFRLQGAARAFEAHVAWRLKDSRDREVATGFATASLGTSPVWGTFTTDVRVPENVTGVVTLEVFWPSPRDGADVGRVSIPLRVP